MHTTRFSSVSKGCPTNGTAILMSRDHGFEISVRDASDCVKILLDVSSNSVISRSGSSRLVSSSGTESFEKSKILRRDRERMSYRGI